MPPAAARPSARRRSVIVVLILAFVLLGFFALGRLPVDPPPSPDAPRLHLHYSVPGLAAPVIDAWLTRRLEAVLAGIPGVASMDADTTTGSVRIDLRLERSRDAAQVQRAVMARIDQLGTSLPAALDPPSLTWMDPSSPAVEFVLVSGTRDALALRDWSEFELSRRLRELPGVEEVDVRGGAVREILVMPDQRRLAGYGLSFEDLLRAIRNNTELDSRPRQPPANGSGRQERVQTGNLAAVAAVPVLLPDGESVRLSEVARVTMLPAPTGAAPGAGLAEGVRVTVHKQAQAALSEVVASVRAHVDWMRANRLIPEAIEIRSLPGPFEEARGPVRSMSVAFLAGWMAVLVVTHLFWGKGRRTLMLGIIVLASLQAVFVAMALLGVALDVMTLGGLVLGTGLFAGNVMLKFDLTTRSPQSHADGFNPVAAPLVFLAAALIPVFLAGGDTGTHYRKLVTGFAGAWLFSALLAGWLVPVFDARKPYRAMEHGSAAIGHALSRARRAYEHLLQRLLRKPAPPLILAAIVVVAAVLALLGRAPPVPVAGPGQDIVLRVLGTEDAGAVALARNISQTLGALPEFRRVTYSAQFTEELLMPRLDELRAGEFGVDLVVAGRALAIAQSGIPAGIFKDADHRYNVRLRLPPEDAGSLIPGKILLLGELEHRPAVHLGDVATLERVTVPAHISRHNGKPAVEIIARLQAGAAPTQALKKVQTAVRAAAVPPGSRVVFGRDDGSARDREGLVTALMAMASVFAAVLLFYRSLRIAVLVISTAGITLTVTFAVMWLAGLPASTPAWMGAIWLLGISSGHAALLVSECAAQAPGMAMPRRIERAARQQFRPLLSMALAGIAGVASLIWVNGSASPLYILAVMLAMGLVFSLLVNLFLAPPLYGLISRLGRAA